MTFTFKQLRTKGTKQERLKELKQLLEDLGLDTTNWKDGSVQQTHLQLEAEIYNEMQQRAAQITLNTLNQYASGSALTLLSDSHFDNQRVEAKQTIGLMKVDSKAFARPASFLIGELKVTDPNNTFPYVNNEQITLNGNNPSGSFEFIAEEPGAHFNINTGVTMSLETGATGITVTNPPNSTGTSGSWITTEGVDRESDKTLRQRNAVKWSTFQRGDLTKDRVKSLVLSASTDLTNVTIKDQNPRGAGTADVYIAQDLKTATDSQITSSQDKLNNAFFANTVNPTERIKAQKATEVTFPRNIHIWYGAGAPFANVEQAVFSASNDYLAGLPIGGKSFDSSDTSLDETFSGSLNNIAPLDELYRDLRNIDGVNKVKINSGSQTNPSYDDDIKLKKTEKLVPPSNWGDKISFFEMNS